MPGREEIRLNVKDTRGPCNRWSMDRTTQPHRSRRRRFSLRFLPPAAGARRPDTRVGRWASACSSETRPRTSSRRCPARPAALAYDTYAGWVSANVSTDTVMDFDFAGGKLALWMNDSNPDDDTGGESGCGTSRHVAAVAPVGEPVARGPTHHAFRTCKLSCPGLRASIPGMRRVNPHVARGASHGPIASGPTHEGPVASDRERRFTR